MTRLYFVIEFNWRPPITINWWLITWQLHLLTNDLAVLFHSSNSISWMMRRRHWSWDRNCWPLLNTLHSRRES